jgi:hypothetical protein
MLVILAEAEAEVAALEAFEEEAAVLEALVLEADPLEAELLEAELLEEDPVAAAQLAWAAARAWPISADVQADVMQGVTRGVSLDCVSGLQIQDTLEMSGQMDGRDAAIHFWAHSGTPLKFWAATRPAAAAITMVTFILVVGWKNCGL